MASARRYVLPGSARPSHPPVASIPTAFPWDPALAPSHVGSVPYFRLTVPMLPATRDVHQQWLCPIGLVVSPGLATDVPIIDLSSAPALVRCRSCSAYLCPQVSINADGQTWVCPICGSQCDSPWPLASRTEYTNRVYDVIAPPAYMRMSTVPIFLFVLDVSPRAFTSGLTPMMVASIKSSLASLPDHLHVGLMSMCDRLSVFDFMSNRQLVLPDLGDVSLAVKLAATCPPLSRCRASFTAALNSLSPGEGPGNCIGSALGVLDRLLSKCGGVIFIGYCGLPAHGIHILKPRSPAISGDPALLRPPESVRGYRDLSLSLNLSSISVHIFAIGDAYCDLASVGLPSAMTAGSCHWYKEGDLGRLHEDLFSALTEQYDWNASLRLRVSRGLRVIRTYGNCTVSQGQLVMFPVLARTASIAFELAVEEVVESPVLLQVGYVFTDRMNRRIVRVFSFGAELSSGQLSGVDEAALAVIMARRLVAAVLNGGWVVSRDALAKEAARLLERIPHACMHHILHGMAVAEMLRPALGYDWEMAQLVALRSLNVIGTMLYFYPRLVCVDAGGVVMPAAGSSFAKGHVFVVHCWDRVYVWVGAGAAKEWLEQGFGVRELARLPADVPELEGNANKAIRKIIDEAWGLSGRYLPVEVIGQGDPKERVFSELLVDEPGPGGPNLADWMARLKTS